MTSAPLTSTNEQRARWLEGANKIAIQAGALILDIYENQVFETYAKDDESPVTSADYAANRLIVDELAKLTPDIPILSEEGSHLSFAERQTWTRYWLIDPIDGTQEFIAGSGDFGVVIALVEQHQPILGITYWPAQDTLYYAQAGQGAFKQTQQERSALGVRILARPDQEAIRIAISRRQPLERITKRMSSAREYTTVALGSCSLKACFVAEGKADCFLRVGPTGEWDTAAAEVIVGEAGGHIVAENFEPLSYNRKDDLGNPNFIILGDPQVTWKQIFIQHQNYD